MSDDPRRYSPWSPPRAARLGFLLGLGWDPHRVADDAVIASTPSAVARQAQRLGLPTEEAAFARMPRQVLARIDAAAAKRRLTREGLTRKLLLAAGGDEGLIDNIIDDGA